ncbi:MAG TPA: EamA family transporter [Albidovulum sp.]|uniref:EamA family transporter n=1 Tax=Albidovulum sp. TaxID=1872424 RepID=UPI002C18ECD8|nr:EamA family transporter [Albidovulum sp.]
MTVTVFLAVLAAAFLHAVWNALLRVGTSRIAAMMVLSVGQGVIGLVIVLMHDWPVSAAWPWIIASGLIHVGYQTFLSLAYEHGDLSRVYPLARGGAPLITLIVGWLWFSEAISPAATAGVLVLGGGILLLASGVWTSGESRRMLPYAFGSACATAGYTLADGFGARVSGDPVTFLGWVMLMSGTIFAILMFGLRGKSSIPTAPRVWALGSLAAVASYGAYAVVVWAMTQAPIAMVAALRESSILFAVLIGWLVFKEKMTPTKALSAVMIACGVLLMRLAA